MAYKTIYNGVVFVEGRLEHIETGEEVEAIMSAFMNEQLKSLRDVKDNLAKQAISRGFNCIMNFTYGQKERGFWSFSQDGIAYWGKGMLANMPKEEYNKLCEDITK